MIGTTSLALTTVVAVMIMALPMCAIWWFDRRLADSGWTAIAIWSWGAVGGTLAVVQGYSDGQLIAAVVVMSLPMAMKVAGRQGFDLPADGLVYGLALAGGWVLGWVGARIAIMPGDSDILSASIGDAGIWVLVWSLLGAVAGLSSLTARRSLRAAIAVFGVVLAAAVAVAWMSFHHLLPVVTQAGLASVVSISLLGTILIAILVFWREGKVLRSELGEEVSLGVLPPWAGEVFPRYWRRVGGSWWPVMAERTVISRLVSRLAVRKHALRRASDPVDEVQWLEVVQLRNRLQKMIEPQSEGEATRD